MLRSSTGGLSLLTVVLILSAAFPAAGQAPNASHDDIVAEITRLDSIWLDAYVTADVDAVDAVLADDFAGQIFTTMMDKEQILDRVRASTGVEAMLLDTLVVNVYGDVAVAHALRRRVSRTPEGPVEAPFVYTDVYQYRDGKWLAITGQSAPR